MKKRGWGFDVRNIDKKVRPQDDFFHYASGGWMKRNPIPKAEPRWGSFTMLRHTTDRQLRVLLKKISEQPRRQRVGAPTDASGMIRDLYRSGVNLGERRRQGLTPLQPLFDRIKGIKNKEGVVRVSAHLERIGAGGMWGTMIDQDMRDSERYIIYLCQGGLGMPDRDYYLKNDTESKRVRAAYAEHLLRLLQLAGRGTRARGDALTVLKIETALAKVSMTKEDVRDVDKTYHKKSLPQLKKFTPRIAWEDYFTILGTKPKEVVVMQPNFLKGAERILNTFPVEAWQTYLSTHVINSFAGLLAPKFVKENFRFYGTTLTGTKHMQPLWRRILRVVNGGLSELFGELYVKEYFPPEAKRKMLGLVDDLFRAYEVRIKSLDWMSAGTKRKAVKKLHHMSRKIGYPERWKTYRGLRIRTDDYVGNVMRACEYEHKRGVRRLAKPVDHKEWFMSPQTVNAYHSSGLNDIVFPAAILQHPFFGLTADDAINYGGIGSVIGHEITHGFDDQGSKFDGKGNRKTWWTKADSRRFTKKAGRLIREFNGYRIAPGVHVNGQLTLGENIADLGGISIAYDAYQQHLRKAPRKTIAGFTPEQRFFLGYAGTECEQERLEFRKTLALTNVHSPSDFRVNGPISNLSEFYEAFGVKKGDKLYRPPHERAKIW